MCLALYQYYLKFQLSCKVKIISPDFRRMETSRGGGGRAACLAENQKAELRVAKVIVEIARCWALQFKCRRRLLSNWSSSFKESGSEQRVVSETT